MIKRPGALLLCVISCAVQGSLSCGGRSALDPNGSQAEGIQTGLGGLAASTTLSQASVAGFGNGGGATSATGGTRGYPTSTAGAANSGGSKAATGGAWGYPTSTAGAASSGGSKAATGGLTGSGGLSAATGGQSGTGGCAESPAQSEIESLIDDLENGSGRILNTDGRVGAWYSFNSGEDTHSPQVPAPTTPGVPIVPTAIPSSESPSAPCGSQLAMHTWGGGYLWAGIGFDLNFDGSTYGTYNAGAFEGITFFASGSDMSAIDVRISTASTTSTQYGGTCTYDQDETHNEGCQPHHARVDLDDELTQHWVPFDSLEPFYSDWSWSSPVGSKELEKNQITNIQFYATTPFDFWIDDVSFYAGQPGCCGISPVQCRGVIDFGNTDLRTAMGQGDRSCSEVCYIEELNLWGSSSASEPQSYNGLQCLVSLRKLTVANEALDDVSILSSLHNLNYLNLSGNRVNDIQALMPLTQLKALDLSDNLLSDTQALASLTRLSTIRLNNNALCAIDGLKGLTHLTTLTLGSNAIANIVPLSSLTALKTLDLSNNVVGDVEPLGKLTQLQSLELAFNSVTNVAPLSALTNLTWLTLTNNRIESLAGFGNLPKLQTLDLSNNQISDLAHFGNMASLTTLSLSSNRVTSAQLGDLLNLQYLDLSKNRLNDLANFGNLPALMSVNLTQNQLSNLRNAGNLPKLYTLDLTGNQISDVTGIASMSEVKYLTLSNNHIRQMSSLTELAQLNSLVTLKLAGNQITTLVELPVLEQLTSLDLSSNELTDVTELAQLKALKHIFLSGNQLSDNSGLGALSALKEISYLDLEGNQITDLSVFLTFSWAPPYTGDRYATYSTLNLENNPIKCDEQADNIAQLKSYRLSVYTDCPSAN